jgi:hypothetical protein
VLCGFLEGLSCARKRCGAKKINKNPLSSSGPLDHFESEHTLIMMRSNGQ